jgi:hypothetical protein
MLLKLGVGVEKSSPLGFLVVRPRSKQAMERIKYLEGSKAIL